MNGLLLGRIHGIAVRLHWSVLLVAWLIAWSLSTEVLPDSAPGRADAVYWFTGATVAAAFFASLILHELGHSVVAQRRGVEVESITLWLLGGLASLGRRPARADDALAIAAAGPLVSVGLSLGFAVLAGSLSSLGGADVAVAGLAWLAAMNVMLALFNLLPAYPLDGGRIYQAWTWRRTGDDDVATDKAARLGRVVGSGLVALGLLEAAMISFVGGLWLVMIGFFLREAGRVEADAARIDDALDTYRVRDVMSSAPLTVNIEGTLAEVVHGLILGGRHAAYPVLERSGALAGLLTVNQVRQVDPSRWPTTRIGEVATNMSHTPVVSSTDPIRNLAHALSRSHETRSLVVDDGQLVGIVSPSDLARLLTAVDLASAATAIGN